MDLRGTRGDSGRPLRRSYSSVGEVTGAWTTAEECSWEEASPSELYLESAVWTAGCTGLSPARGAVQLERCWEPGGRNISAGAALKC